MARVAIKEIHSLTSGKQKPNVFVTANSNFTREFTLILPGCKAKAVKKESGAFHIYHLAVDTSYGDLADAGRKSGLYSARKTGGVWDAARKPNGKVGNREDRVVVVSDSFNSPDDAVRQAAMHASEAPIGGVAI